MNIRPENVTGRNARASRRVILSNNHRFNLRPEAMQWKGLFIAAAILLLPFFTRAQSLNVPIVVQPAEWTGMSTVSPSGARSNAPVTVGIGIPDAAGIDCPGTQDNPQN